MDPTPAVTNRYLANHPLVARSSTIVPNSRFAWASAHARAGLKGGTLAAPASQTGCRLSMASMKTAFIISNDSRCCSPPDAANLTFSGRNRLILATLLGPGGAADNSPGREPWGENRSNTPLSPRQGATEQHMHDSVVPPGLKHLTSIVSNPGLAPGAIIDRPLTGASDALIADHPFAASSRIRSAQSCHPSHQPSFLSWTRLDQCERTDWQIAIGTVASVHRLDRIEESLFLRFGHHPRDGSRR